MKKPIDENNISIGISLFSIQLYIFLFRFFSLSHIHTLSDSLVFFFFIWIYLSRAVYLTLFSLSFFCSRISAAPCRNFLFSFHSFILVLLPLYFPSLFYFSYMCVYLYPIKSIDWIDVDADVQCWFHSINVFWYCNMEC